MIVPSRVHADRPVRTTARDGRTVVVKRYVNGGTQGTYMCALWASPVGVPRRPPGLALPSDTVLDEVVMDFLAGEPVGAG